MLKIENTEVMGWEHAIRGMRNPKNSWAKSDSFCVDGGMFDGCQECSDKMRCAYRYGDGSRYRSDGYIGPNDLDLMTRLRNAGTDHRKFMRMITVYLDITAPLYWWKEYDTYKVGTVANSCSTMHKIHDKEFTLDDFSCEHLIDSPIDEVDAETFIINELDVREKCKVENHLLAMGNERGYISFEDEADFVAYYSPKDILECFIIPALNANRQAYLSAKTRPMKDNSQRERVMKRYWWQMIQLLPSSYNQKRTVMLNYEVLANMYKSRRNHKLTEWHTFCDWIESLPYSELITGKVKGENNERTV